MKGLSKGKKTLTKINNKAFYYHYSAFINNIRLKPLSTVRFVLTALVNPYNLNMTSNGHTVIKGTLILIHLHDKPIDLYKWTMNIELLNLYKLSKKQFGKK